MLRSFVILVLVHASLQAVPPCDSGCDTGFCSAECYGLPEDKICICKEKNVLLETNMFQYVVNLFIQDAPRATEWECTGSGCGSLEATPPVIGSKEDCQTACDGLAECKSYIYQQVYGKLLHTCTLMKECKSVEDVIDTGCTLCQAGRNCVTCPKVPLTQGSTSIHWTCTNQPNGDIYNNELPDGTECHPLHKCTDPVVSVEDTITCVENGEAGEWQNAEGVVEVADQKCNCNDLLVANSPGTVLFCNSQEGLEKQENGDILLTESNTCVLSCDGHFVTEISCEFDEVGEVTWMSKTTEESSPIKDCITCWMDVCESRPTAPPTTTTTTTTPEPTEAP